jgi:hypothetical protein
MLLREALGRPLCAFLLAFLVSAPPSRATVIFLYDFPGGSGSGLAGDQTNPQPANATFSDFTRANLSLASTNGQFTSVGWSQAPAIDTTQYEGFSITSAPNYVLDLTSLTFAAKGESNGPVNMRVALFLNGSSTPYASFDFTPTSSLASYTFNFTALTDADAVTSAAFLFYG